MIYSFLRGMPPLPMIFCLHAVLRGTPVGKSSCFSKSECQQFVQNCNSFRNTGKTFTFWWTCLKTHGLRCYFVHSKNSDRACGTQQKRLLLVAKDIWIPSSNFDIFRCHLQFLAAQRPWVTLVPVAWCNVPSSGTRDQAPGTSYQVPMMSGPIFHVVDVPHTCNEKSGRRCQRLAQNQLSIDCSHTEYCATCISAHNIYLATWNHMLGVSLCRILPMFTCALRAHDVRPPI